MNIITAKSERVSVCVRVRVDGARCMCVSVRGVIDEVGLRHRYTIVIRIHQARCRDVSFVLSPSLEDQACLFTISLATSYRGPRHPILRGFTINDIINKYYNCM